MRRLGCLIALCAFPAYAQTQPQCGPRADVVGVLSKQYGETAFGMGINNAGSLVEVFTSPSGSWSLLITDPKTMATCLVTDGQGWAGGSVVKGGEPS